MAKSWINTIQNIYKSLDEFKTYSDIFGLVEKMKLSTELQGGFIEKDIEDIWNTNYIVGGSVNPEDFGIPTIEEIIDLLIPYYKEAILFTEADFGITSEMEFSVEACRLMYWHLKEFIDSIPVNLNILVHMLGAEFISSFAIDFWLSRNGHDAGFFDDEQYGEYAELLQDKARQQGEKYVYVSDTDGKIYFG